ncbi:MAG: hydroxymyristoyl-ACP dehydratase [Bacteroidales bacterium]|nr:hydroxymyristoyl-ACP dehydratase [Bacteroidales bacterium]
MNVINLIPQKPPFVFVDDISDVEEMHFFSRFEVKADTPLLRNGAIAEAGIIEHVAQSMAAYIGFHQQNEVEIGVVASVTKFVFHSLPPIGSVLHTEIIIENRIFAISQIYAKVFCNHSLIAEGNMRLVQTIRNE